MRIALLCVLSRFVAMYGDEVGAIVLDMGSTYTRCGFAGEDTPKAVFPTAAGVTYGDKDMKRVGASLSAVGDGDTAKLSSSSAAASSIAKMSDSKDTKATASSSAAAATAAAAASSKRHYYIGERTYNYYREGQDIVKPVQHGLVTDWDGVEGILDYSFRKWLQVDTKEHPMLLTESNWNTVDRRSKLAQLVFEKFDAPAMFLCKNAVAASFSVGRPTSLVLDVGGGSTSAVPVHDGYVLHKGVKKTKLGGDQLDEWMLAEFTKAQKPIVPRYKFRRDAVGTSGAEFKTTVLDLPNTTASYHQHMQLELVRDIKETVCRVSDNPFDAESNKTIPGVQYELPDGNLLDIGTERFSIPEKLFAPDPATDLKNDFEFGFRGLHHLVIASIEAVDVDLRKDLYQGLVITGGVSCMNGLPQRVNKELSKLSLKVKLVNQNNKNERKFGNWIGGSILASLGSFHQMWYSRSEYDEHGASLLYRKCP